MTKNKYYELMNKAYWDEDDYEEAKGCGGSFADWSEVAYDGETRALSYATTMDETSYITASIEGWWI